MRRLLVLVLTAAALWASWWLVASRSLEGALAAWFEARRAEGWQADYGALTVRGFPNRLDTTIDDLALADPETGLGWHAPFFQILSLSYKPNHVIAVWPDEQLVFTPEEKITVTADKMQASVVFKPDTALELDRTSFELEGFRLASDRGWWAEFPTARLASRAVPARTGVQEIAFSATEMRPSADLIALLGDTGLPEVFEALRMDAEFGFDAPWDRRAIEERRPQITSVKLRMFEAHWGELELQAAGDLTVDEKGIPEGAIGLRATNWREMLEIGVNTGVLPEGLADTLESAFELLAGLKGNRNTLDVGLSFHDGRVSLGPVPLGPAPRLVIR